MRITIEEVSTRDDWWHVALNVTADDGSTSRMLHTFPTDTMEWRAAEYGIDHEDRSTLLDIVLVEAHLTPNEIAKGVALYDAPDIDTARRDHLARCAAAKLRLRMSTRAKGSPLDRVRAESVMHSEVIEVKREHVARTRAAVAEERRRRQLPAAVLSGAERAAALLHRWRPTSSERVMP